MNPQISVVIATYERPDLLLRCVDALLRQTLAAHRFEIVVIDDGSSREARERTMAALAARRRLLRAPTLRFLWLPTNRGPAAARNHGILAAHGEIIAFTDDDTLPCAHWLAAGLAAIATGADAVAGSIDVPLPAIPTDHERDAALLSHGGFDAANCFARRSVLEVIGGFDERYRYASREDTDLCFRLRKSGALVRAARNARVVRPGRPASWGASLAQQRKLMFDALLYKKFPRNYRRYVNAHPPWNDYAAVVAGTCCIVNAAAGYRVLTVVSFAAWLGISVAVARRRLAHTSHAPRHVAEIVVTSLLVPWLSVYWRTRGALRFRVPFA